MRQLNVRVPDELQDDLRQAAERRGVKQSDLVREAIAVHLRGTATAGKVNYGYIEKRAEEGSSDSSPSGEEAKSEVGYRCPRIPCGFRAGSPRASCPSHGRKVVPV